MQIVRRSRVTSMTGSFAVISTARYGVDDVGVVAPAPDHAQRLLAGRQRVDHAAGAAERPRALLGDRLADLLRRRGARQRARHALEHLRPQPRALLGLEQPGGVERRGRARDHRRASARSVSRGQDERAEAAPAGAQRQRQRRPRGGVPATIRLALAVERLDPHGASSAASRSSRRGERRLGLERRGDLVRALQGPQAGGVIRRIGRQTGHAAGPAANSIGASVWRWWLSPPDSGTTRPGSAGSSSSSSPERRWPGWRPSATRAAGAAAARA